MKGWVLVGPEAVQDDDQLQEPPGEELLPSSGKPVFPCQNCQRTA